MSDALCPVVLGYGSRCGLMAEHPGGCVPYVPGEYLYGMPALAHPVELLNLTLRPGPWRCWECGRLCDAWSLGPGPNRVRMWPCWCMRRLPPAVTG